MVLAEIESAQKDGVVGVVYNVGDEPNIDRHGIWQGSKLLRALPLRINAIHYCYDNHVVRSVLSLGMLMVGEQIRARVRTHYGRF